MEIVVRLIKLLPKMIDLQSLLSNEPEAEYILNLATENLSKIRDECVTLQTDESEEVAFLVTSLSDLIWEKINIGHFSEVPLIYRKLYAVANFFKIVYLLQESLDNPQLERCYEIIDKSLLVGCIQDVYTESNSFVETSTSFLNEALGASAIHYTEYNMSVITSLKKSLESYIDTKFWTKVYAKIRKSELNLLPFIEPLPENEYICDITILECPPVDNFRLQHFEPQKPGLLKKIINHWPALKKWRDPNYLIKLAGHRTVPVEIGSTYTTEDWSQEMIKIKDFLSRQFGREECKSGVEYLAQHELFDQIPELKEDIRVPDYCCLTSSNEAADVDIKAWLGPKGTISPMHQDPKHNILCQVFGHKKIILASADDSELVYPHQGELLANTSQIDAENIDYTKYPLARQAKFYQLTLQEGECLYIPPKWWHFVKSLSKSFSVSFWWE